MSNLQLKILFTIIIAGLIALLLYHTRLLHFEKTETMFWASGTIKTGNLALVLLGIPLYLYLRYKIRANKNP